MNLLKVPFLSSQCRAKLAPLLNLVSADFLPEQRVCTAIRLEYLQIRRLIWGTRLGLGDEKTVSSPFEENRFTLLIKQSNKVVGI